MNPDYCIILGLRHQVRRCSRTLLTIEELISRRHGWRLIGLIPHLRKFVLLDATGYIAMIMRNDRNVAVQSPQVKGRLRHPKDIKDGSSASLRKGRHTQTYSRHRLRSAEQASCCLLRSHYTPFPAMPNGRATFVRTDFKSAT
jgi:hypothetical protein